jgi:hypothetical protein
MNMKLKISYAALLLVLTTGLLAQTPRENLILLTDRGHYISGESIYYRAFYQGPAGSEKAEWSKVLYVELIMPNGTALAQGKVPIDTGGVRGRLLIPEGISSGSYYLKAYTRWMRNCGAENLVYTLVRIYDPFLESVLPEDSTGWKPSLQESLMGRQDSHPATVLSCNLNGSSFQTRQEVVAELQWKFPYASADLTVSVARTGLHDDQEYFRPGCPPNGGQGTQFLPETKGLSLTGKAVSAADGKPAPYATIYVSVLGENREFFCNYSDSAGRFFFSFPEYKGHRDLFVSTYHPDLGDLELRIDRDFSTDVPELPSYPLALNDSLVRTITDMSVNAQVSRQYYPQIPLEAEKDSARKLFFYGRPSSTIHFDDFIKLPRLEEYFVEVIPQVAVKKNRGKTHFSVLGPHPDLSIYPPLVMIDGVAIFDVEAVLAVSPRLIDRIEIVNAPYIRGNVTFGGIVSLISKNNDLGYIDLPSSGLLVNYQMLDQPVEPSFEETVADPRLPDVRNTLYWNPELILGPDESKVIRFTTSDQAGEYEMLIRGSDSTGRYVDWRMPFQVR